MTRSPAFGWLVLIGCALAPAVGLRADTVKLKGGITATGKVLRDDAEGVVIQFPSGQVKSYPRERVVSVHLDRLADLDRAEALLAQGRLADAAEAFQRLLESGRDTRTQVQAGLRLVECRRLEGRTAEAIDTYLDVLVQDSTESALAGLPLVWSPEEATAEVIQRAIIWTGPRNEPRLTEVAQLLACAVFVSADRLERARPLLPALTASTDQTIGSLAQVLLWRTELSAEGLAGRVSAWKGRVANLAEPARGPAWFVIGEGLQRLREPSQAALAYLHPLFLYDRDAFLASLAGWRAAACLLDDGRPADARTILQEVAQRFPLTPHGRLAQGRLQTLGGPGPASGPAPKTSEQGDRP